MDSYCILYAFFNRLDKVVSRFVSPPPLIVTRTRLARGKKTDWTWRVPLPRVSRSRGQRSRRVSRRIIFWSVVDRAARVYRLLASPTQTCVHIIRLKLLVVSIKTLILHLSKNEFALELCQFFFFFFFEIGSAL